MITEDSSSLKLLNQLLFYIFREQSLAPYLFLRPEKLPEFDDFKSNSISVETMSFFKRIVAVVPDSFDIDER